MLDISGAISSVHCSITARPNCSLTPKQTLLVFCIICLVTFLLALGFVIIGAWPILLFSSMELLAIGYCFYHTLRHASDYERLTIDDDKVVVETHEPGHDQRFELSGYWSRVVLDCLPNGYCRHLILRSHGREIEFGRYISSEERLDLARLLKPRLGGFLS